MLVDSSGLLQKTRNGFEQISIRDEIKQSALRHLEDWLRNNRFAGLVADAAGYRPLLEWMITSEKFDLLLDSFYQVMPFGTGGRRGPVGIGPNRINPYTMASSVQGHVEYLKKRFPNEAKIKVVVAYDVRRYADLRQLYPAEVPNPVLGFTSKDFAHIAASVYRAGGVSVYMLPDEPEDYISTPELSFLIGRYGAHGGLNVSASHNHPDDNGGKFYNDRGGQEVPPYDEQMVKIVETITDVHGMPYEKALASGLVHPVAAEDRQAYVDLNLGLRLRRQAGPAKIVFSPLHGTGSNTVGRCLRAMGFAEGKQFFPVKSQMECRGDFANVKFRTPNPEVPESLEAAIEEGKRVGADLVLATDPDADRIGGAVPYEGDFRFLNGNEFAVLVTRYRLESLRRAGKLPPRSLILKTQVTTELMARIAEDFGAQVIGNLLVGFKYIGDILDHLEREGRFGGLEAKPEDFVVAAEESHGLLLTPLIRDKDAAGAAVVLAELASEVKEGGGSLYEYLIDTYKRYGYHRSLLRSTIMQGAAGTAAMARIQEEIRRNRPSSMGGLKVLSVEDFWDEKAFGPFKSETDRSSRNLLTLTLEGGLKASIRPSGTEPKNKVYMEKASKPIGADASDQEFWRVRKVIDDEVEQFSNRFMKEMLAIIGVELPTWALEISDLVALGEKRHFAEVFVSAFRERTLAALRSETTRESVGRWADQELKSYGPDARLLVARAFRSHLEAERAGGGVPGEILAAEEEIFFGATPETKAAR